MDRFASETLYISSSQRLSRPMVALRNQIPIASTANPAISVCRSMLRNANRGACVEPGAIGGRIILGPSGSKTFALSGGDAGQVSLVVLAVRSRCAIGVLDQALRPPGVPRPDQIGCAGRIAPRHEIP